MWNLLLLLIRMIRFNRYIDAGENGWSRCLTIGFLVKHKGLFVISELLRGMMGTMFLETF